MGAGGAGNDVSRLNTAGAGGEARRGRSTPPPGWPAMPAGWQPPSGWQPDPSWPAAPADWEYWRPLPPARAPEGGELRVLVDGRSYVFQPGQLVRIGRAPDNDVTVGDPTVSRQHARLVWGDGGWTFEGIGQAATWLHGQPVTRVAVTGPLDLVLGSAQGPVLRVEALGDRRAGDPGAGPARPPRRSRRRARAVHPTDELAEAIHILFPLRSWLHTSGLLRGLRLLVIVYALLPLVFLAAFASAAEPDHPGLGVQPLHRAAVGDRLLAADPPRPDQAARGLGCGRDHRVGPGVDQRRDRSRQRSPCTAPGSRCHRSRPSASDSTRRSPRDCRSWWPGSFC